MELQNRRIFEPQVTAIDGYRVHVAVTQDRRFAEQFLCTVSLYPRTADSQGGDLDLDAPLGGPHVLGEFATPEAAYERGVAYGHILTTTY